MRMVADAGKIANTIKTMALAKANQTRMRTPLFTSCCIRFFILSVSTA
jgi:hypothetical protein